MGLEQCGSVWAAKGIKVSIELRQVSAHSTAVIDQQSQNYKNIKLLKVS